MAPRIELNTPSGDGRGGQQWRDHAACLGMDTSLFFHTVGGSSHVKDSLRICNGYGDRPPCPVREECGEFALSFPKEEDIAGIFGGMTPAERHRIRKQRRQTVIEYEEKKKERPVAVLSPSDPELYSSLLARLLHLVHDVMIYDSQGKRRYDGRPRPNPAR